MSRSARWMPALVLSALVAACRTGAPIPTSGPADRVVNIAHRGASGHAPENTLAAFDLAQQMNADYLELDVYLTRDGVPVVLHDATLNRTTRGPAENCVGEVGEKTLAQIRTCEAGSWFNRIFPAAARPSYASGVGVPTLEEVFQRYGQRANYLVEIKQPQRVPGVEAKVLELYERYGLRRPAAERWQVVTQSFSEESMRKLHALAPEIPLNQLLNNRETPESILAKLDRIREYAIGIGPAKSTVNAEMVRAAHQRCLRVFPYTVNDPQEVSALLALGVDGIISDFPERVNSLLGVRSAIRRMQPHCVSSGIAAS